MPKPTTAQFAQYMERERTRSINLDSQRASPHLTKYPSWRYMTDAYNPQSHWWEYHGIKSQFVTIAQLSNRSYEYHTYRNGRIAHTGHAHKLVHAMRDSLKIAC